MKKQSCKLKQEWRKLPCKCDLDWWKIPI